MAASPAFSAPRLYRGPAGWVYPDWKGTVYPRGLSKGRDMLRWLSDYVDLVELNASFYAAISPRSAETWLAALEEAPHLRFSIKVWGALTHEAHPPSDAELDEWIAGVQPLLEAERALCFLVQFPFRVHCTAAARARTESIAARLPDLPIAVEFRHDTWNVDSTFDWLDRRGFSWVDVDQPPLTHCLQLTGRRTGSLGYARLHGRNAAAWFDPAAGRDGRYDYRYRSAELSAMVDRLRAPAGAGGPYLLVGNNHFHGKAVATVLALVAEMTGQRVSFPELVLAQDPTLARWHRPAPGSLF